MEFKDVCIETNDFWHDLIDGGYIEPESLLENAEDIEKINDAIATLKEFEREAIHKRVIEYF